MNKYKIIFKLKNGFVGEEIVYAVNRLMAYESFEKVEYYKDVVEIDCRRIID